ncbi:unnamed protein product [Rhizoctonia solani]|uniref:Protein kinase domain-containing protein n=1 Tax=Rhizoctonia solani TaxID=456999 RepID=A0A8H3BN09_9AGAM|nr:unnamed protein product [Rhizoctonia solani]
MRYSIKIHYEQTMDQIVDALSRRGCPDVTPQINFSKCSEYPIAAGGYCDVYQGMLYSGTVIAIKSLRVYDTPGMESNRANILKHAAKELYHWSKLCHRNILPLMGLALFRGCISMVSQWMEMGNVTAFLSMNPRADRMGLCIDTCTGLCYIHDQDMVHGDLKGANIMVSSSGIAMITDFGNTQMKEITLKFTNLNTPGLSLRWAAPEFFTEGKSLANKSSDVWAYGMTALEILTGKLPFEDMSDFNYVAAQVKGTLSPTRPNSKTPPISDGLWEVLKLCWSQHPDNRPSIITVKNRLDGLTAKQPQSTLSLNSFQQAPYPAATNAPTLQPLLPHERDHPEGLLSNNSSHENTLTQKLTQAPHHCNCHNRIIPLEPASPRGSTGLLTSLTSVLNRFKSRLLGLNEEYTDEGNADIYEVALPGAWNDTPILYWDEPQNEPEPVQPNTPACSGDGLSTKRYRHPPKLTYTNTWGSCTELGLSGSQYPLIQGQNPSVHVLGVGLSWSHTWANALPSPVHDICWLKEFFVDQKKVQFTSLLDDEVSFDIIHHSVMRMYSNAQPNDCLVLYFAGHGDDENAFELYDDDPGSLDEVILNDWIVKLRRETSKTIPVYIVFDFCRENPASSSAQLDSGVTVFWSCPPGQYSPDVILSKDLPYSCFLLALFLAIDDSSKSHVVPTVQHFARRLVELLNVIWGVRSFRPGSWRRKRWCRHPNSCNLCLDESHNSGDGSEWLDIRLFEGFDNMHLGELPDFSVVVGFASIHMPLLIRKVRKLVEGNQWFLYFSNRYKQGIINARDP